MAEFYEFFAGAGMVRAGLGEGWTCRFANDFDGKKGLTYQANWGVGGELHVGDIRNVTTSQLPGQPDLVWGSFPCQDLSLAGHGAGLEGERSGTFYPFWSLIEALRSQDRAPRIVAVENVCGTLTSHHGQDFEAICSAFADSGYTYGALVINAQLFVPQSRPRLFLIGVRPDIKIESDLLSAGPVLPFHTPALQRAFERVSPRTLERRVWWNLPTPRHRTRTFADVIEDAPTSVNWHAPEETSALIAMMSPVNLDKVNAARRAGRRMVGTVYRRTRADPLGNRLQRAEVRFDDVAGCLRTPAGGSSRQVILVVDGASVRSRLISARETARLMGLEDTYKLPASYTEAYHLTGDGVVVPVVRHLGTHLFQPLLGLESQQLDEITRPQLAGLP
ncbi:DNA cytosine methyltransferase [soil metagenome]